MPEIDDKKQEPKKPELKPDDGAAHTLSAFAQSLAYSAVEAPSRGVAQLIDHAATTHLDAAIQHKFDNAGFHQPDAAAYGTHAWAAQQLGSAIGMVLPMKLSHKLMVGRAEIGIAESAKLESTLLDKAVREAHSSARAGLFYGAVLTPSEDQNNNGNFYLNRLKQGANTAVTFGAMGASAAASSEMLGRAANALESKPIHSLFKSPLQTALSSSLVHGAISGIPGGAIQAQLNAVENGKSFASLQDIKESIVSMTLVGGAMGSAGLMAKDAQRNSAPHVDNIAALRLDVQKHSSQFAGGAPDFLSENSSQRFATTRRQESISADSPPVSKSETEAPFRKFDLKLDAIDKAWTQSEVDKHSTLETRSIEYARPDREKNIGLVDWKKFSSWGVEERDVPVQVYRFPGLSTEIVVPAEHAKNLDEIRSQRNQGATTAPFILPEEIAQIVKQLPNPDLVKTVHLLGEESPWNLKHRHERRTDEEKGRAFDYETEDLADATSDGRNKGLIRFYRDSTNDPVELADTAYHEWAHLAEDDVAYKAFPAAAAAEKDGFMARDYAEIDSHENWAVHFGEHFLSPDGATFAKMPESAPIRSLVMAKALRNMLETPTENPSSRRDEFIARVQAAEQIATRRLQESILADIASADVPALGKKLNFLNAAIGLSKSPEIFSNVLDPISDRLLPALKEHARVDGKAEVRANQLALQLNSSETMPPEVIADFANNWRRIDSTPTQVRLYSSLPTAAREYLAYDLAVRNFDGSRRLLTDLISKTDGSERDILENSLLAASIKFDKEGMDHYLRSGNLRRADVQWLEQSTNPESVFAVLATKTTPLSVTDFERFTEQLNPPSLRKLIEDDALRFLKPEILDKAWTSILQRLPQSEQVALFREFGERLDPGFKTLGSDIESMSDTDFGANSSQILKRAFMLYDEYKESPAAILANAQYIRTASSFWDATRVLDGKQAGDLLANSALYSSKKDLHQVIRDLSVYCDAHKELQILASLDGSAIDETSIGELKRLAASNDASVASEARNVMVEMANEHLLAMKYSENASTRLAADDFEYALTQFDDVPSRIAHMDLQMALNGEDLMSIDLWGLTSGLSESNQIQLIGSGALDKLPPAVREDVLNQMLRQDSEPVKAEIRKLLG